MLLGNNITTGGNVEITEKERKTHMQVVGSSGRGKSKFLEMMIQDDIRNNRGLCLLDPHGSLYDKIVRWLETHRLFGKRKIILFNPLEEKFSLGFNPLNLQTKNISTAVDNMIKACATVWGGEDPDEKPLMSKCLTAVFYALIEKKLSLYEAIHLIDTSDSKVRQYLTHDLNHYVAKKMWNNFNKKSKKDFDNDFMSTENRMVKFLMSDAIKTIIGQTHDTIDFYKLMEEGCILLVNLQAIDEMSMANTRLLGHLIINEFYLNCLKRKPDVSAPYYLYIDECGRYITEDIGNILEEGRKFGLHLVLAHQRLKQLEKVIGEDGLDAVMNGCQTKVVFGGLGYKDAKTMVDDLFLGQIDYQEWKERLLRPTIVGYKRTTFRNSSRVSGSTRTRSQSSSRGGSSGGGSGESMTLGGQQTFLPGGMILNTSYSNYSSAVDNWMDGFTDSDSDINMHGEGESEGLEPLMELLSIKEYSLEEQKERAAASIVQQPVQFAIIKKPGKQSGFIKVPDVEIPYANDERVEEFKQKCYLSTLYVKEREKIEQEILERQKLLEHKADQYLIEKAQAEKEEKKARYTVKPDEPAREEEQEKEKVRVRPQTDEEESFRVKIKQYDKQPTEPPGQSKRSAYRAKAGKKKTETEA